MSSHSSQDVILTVSTYSRLSWGNHLSRSFQHAVSGSQSLGDLYEALPCPSNEMPPETTSGTSRSSYAQGEIAPHRGAVICIEDICYGDGETDEDYSEYVTSYLMWPATEMAINSKLMKHFLSVPEDKRPRIEKGCDMHSKKFSDLSLCINKPFWLLHQGSCEHFIVVDQIRLVDARLFSSRFMSHPVTCIYLHLSSALLHIVNDQNTPILPHAAIPTPRLAHKSDPPSGYPFALHFAPLVLDLCQACARVPATLSIIGDLRLGQSPCKLCGPCWGEMGEPPAPVRNTGEVKVVPLRKFQFGW